MKRKILIIAVLVILTLIWSLYCFSNEDNVLENIRLFTQVIQKVENKYVEEVDKAKLVAAATEGLMRPLDPFCQILISDEEGNFPSGNNGVFETMGIAFTIDRNIPAVGAPIFNSPAQRYGLQPGDVIFRINDKVSRNMSLSQVMDQFDIDIGDTLEMSVVPVNERGTVKYKYIRQEYEEKSIPEFTKKDNNYIYLSIKRLTTGTSNAIKNKLSNETDFNGIILDLRNCPNGSSDEAIAIADLFLEQGKLITKINSRHSSVEDDIKSQNKPIISDKPILLLVNKGTFGAAEILSAALSQNEVAAVIGERTAGKTGIQEVLKISSTYAVELTTKEYLTPTKKSLLIEYEENEEGQKEVSHKPGLEPDLTVEGNQIPRISRIMIGKLRVKGFVDEYTDMIETSSKEEVLNQFQKWLDDEEYDYSEESFEKNKDDIYYRIKMESTYRKNDPEQLNELMLAHDPIFKKGMDIAKQANTLDEIFDILEKEKEEQEEENEE